MCSFLAPNVSQKNIHFEKIQNGRVRSQLVSLSFPSSITMRCSYPCAQLLEVGPRWHWAWLENGGYVEGMVSQGGPWPESSTFGGRRPYGKCFPTVEFFCFFWTRPTK